MSTPTQALTTVLYPAGAYEIAVFPKVLPPHQAPPWTQDNQYCGSLTLGMGTDSKYQAIYTDASGTSYTVGGGAVTYSNDSLQFTVNPSAGDSLAFVLTAVQPGNSGAAPFLHGQV